MLSPVPNLYGVFGNQCFLLNAQMWNLRGYKNFWRFTFLYYILKEYHRISSVVFDDQDQTEVVCIDGGSDNDFEHDENTQPAIKSIKLNVCNQQTPSSSKMSGGKKRKLDPELQIIDNILAKEQKKVDPLGKNLLSQINKYAIRASMVDDMMGRLNEPQYRRARFEFKDAVLGVIRDFENWLLDAETNDEFDEV